jgi:translocation and assembly module TamB
MSPAKPPRRILRLLGRGAAFLLLGIIVLVGIALLSVNVGPVSRFIAQKVNGTLESSFKGRVILHRLGHIDFTGIAGAEVEVQDPAGHSVLYARDVDLRLFWPGVVWDALVARAEPLPIPIDRVAAQSLDVNVIDDGSGTPTLAQAFEPKEPPTEEKSGGTSLVIADVAVKGIRVRGALEGVGPIDADLAALAAHLSNDPSGTHLVLENLELTARQLPQIDTLVGRLTADVTLPAEPSHSVASAPGVATQESPATSVYSLSPEPAQRKILATFAGEMAGSTAALSLRMLGEELTGTFDAESLSPATLSKLVPALAPGAPASLTLKVSGVLNDLNFDARLRQESAQVNARGRVQQQDRRSDITARVDMAALDLAHLLPDAPSTRLNLGADAKLRFDDQGGQGSYDVSTGPSRVGVEALPTAKIQGQLLMPKDQPLVTSGTLDIAEPGAPTHVEYSVSSGDSGAVVHVTSNTRVNQPERIKELTAGLSLVGEITSTADFDSARDDLDARVEVRLRELRHPGVGVQRFDASLKARGKASAPELDFSGSLTGLQAAERAITSLRWSARGTSERLALTLRARGNNPDRIQASATLVPDSERMIQAPEVVVSDARGRLRLRAESVHFAGARVQVERLTLDGPGRADLSLTYGPSLEALELRTQELDAARLLQIVGVQTGLTGGVLNLTADYQKNGRAPRGKVTFDLTGLGLGKLKNVSARADLAFERGLLSGDAGLQLARGGKTHIVFKDVKPPVEPVTQASLEAMTGDISLNGDIELSQLQDLMPLGGIERAEGKLRFDVVVQRPANRAERPVWRAHVDSRSLVLVQERPKVEQSPSAKQAEQASPLTVRGIDLNLDAVLEQQSASINARLFDRRGDFLQLDAKWQNIEGARDLMNPERALMNAPVVASIQVPRRVLDQLPAPIRPTDIEGTLSLRVEAEGTLAAPRVRARGRLEKFRAATEQERRRGLDLELAADYAQAGGSAQLSAHDRERSVLALGSRWTGDLVEVSRQPLDKSPILANAQLKLDQFPMDAVPALHDRNVTGTLSGTADLQGLGKDARFELDLVTHKLGVDRLSIDKLRARIQTAGAKLTVHTELSGKAGQANAELTAGLMWGDRLVPVLDAEQLQGALTTQGFRLGALLPLVDGSVSELDGKLDADLRATMQNGTPQLSGRASLTDGVLHVPTVGQRFDRIGAQVAITPESVQIDNVRARGTSGGFEASARATLQGLSPVAANATLNIKEDDKLPVTVEGEAIGDAWGKIEATYQADEASKTNTVHVNLENLHIELPATPPGSIQNLDDAENVRVGYWRRDNEFVTIPLQPMEEPGPPSDTQTVVAVDLGSVWVEKGQQANVNLGGGIQATLGNELDVRGKIETKRGQLDISGKQFDIERGSVTFTGGEPDDPIISAVARYDSPAGYTVYAEYTGTAVRGKLRLSSEPPLSQDEILTLLLFGTPDGSFGANSGGGDSLSTAVGVAGGTAAQGLNRALSDITDIDVSARVDTSTGSPRPELVLQVTPRIAAKVTQALGEPSPGQSPDRTFLTIELRLASAWSLSTMIGDRGASALDLIWRRRY